MSNMGNNTKDNYSLESLKSKIDEIYKSSSPHLESFNTRIYKEVFDVIRDEPKTISKLYFYIESKYGKEYVTNTWAEYFYENYGAKDISKEEIKEEDNGECCEDKSNKNDINEENPAQEESNIIEKNVDNNESSEDREKSCVLQVDENINNNKLKKDIDHDEENENWIFWIIFAVILGFTLLLVIFDSYNDKSHTYNYHSEYKYITKTPTSSPYEANSLSRYPSALQDNNNIFYSDTKTNDLEELDSSESLNLGFAYFNGSAGIAKNMNKAFYWFKKSAEMGNSVAQCMLGLMYQDGNGISKDLKEAFYWIEKSASQGLRDCQYQLGIFYEQGWGVYKNLSLAFYWIEKAAKQGLLDAQLELGSMYLMGYGVTKNIEQAYYWIKKAADGGNDNAKKILNKNFSTPEYQSSYKYMTRSYTKEELKVIKAIIGADASSSDWDIVTYQKALSYQEKFGLKIDGKIGIETLKAVLNDVNKMPSNMQNKQSLINFLRYMVNRRR